MLRNIKGMTASLLCKLKEKWEDLVKLFPLLSFVAPFLILYLKLNITFPVYSFEATWKGRAFYIFFVWFTILEMVVSWEKLQPRAFRKIKSVRTIALIIALLLPTIYTVVSNFHGLNNLIYEWSKKNHVAGGEWWHKQMPLSIEYMVFAAFYFLIIFLQYGAIGLRTLSLSPTFLALVGALYMIDNLYPYGQFLPLQVLTPLTVIFAEATLNFLGYQTSISYVTNQSYGWMPIMWIRDPTNPLRTSGPIGIAWPCSGIESLLIYMLFMLIFLRDFRISRSRKAICFVFGALVTYFINIARIVTLFIIALNYGTGSVEFTRFHEFYGQLCSVTWIAIYPLLVMWSRNIWRGISHL